MIDITKGSHYVSFPSKVASVCGQYGHVFNIVVTDDSVDNGMLCAKGDYVSFDQYEQEAIGSGATITGEILEKGADGLWYVEFTALPSTPVLYMYNSPVSEYAERSLQDESLFYTAQGEVIQGAMLMVTDVIALSDSAFSGTAAEGATVTYDASTNKYTVG